MDIYTLLAKIRKKRYELNLTQDDMAALLNISSSTYNRVENGITPLTLKMFLVLIEILGLSHEELFS